MSGLKKIARNLGVAAFVLSMAAPALAASEPIVGAVSPVTAVVDASTSFSASYSDSDTVTSCALYINGDYDTAMLLTGGANSGTASASHTFSAAGTYDLQVRCTDVAAHIGHGASTSVVISSISPTAPVIGAITPVSATANASVILSASYSNSVAISSCSLYIDGSLIKSMSLTGALSGTASAGYTFTSAGTHTAQARCTDAGPSTGLGAVTNVTVAASGSDSIVPSMPTNLVMDSPSSDSTPTFNWAASTDNVGVVAYEISFDGSFFVDADGARTVTAGLLANGSHVFSVRARDAAGNVSASASLNFTVNAPGLPPGPPLPGPAFTLEIMDADAAFVFGNHDRDEFVTRNGKGCEMASATAAVKLSVALGNITNETARAAIESFVACGTASTMSLGAGERLGIVNSFRAAFGHLPSTQVEWFDVIKIGNGRFPGSINVAAEARAKASFKLVYLRDANMSVTADANAVVVMAYGLRPLPRNLNSEAAAIITFRAVYGRTPTSATDWDIVRAIAYSGATR